MHLADEVYNQVEVLMLADLMEPRWPGRVPVSQQGPKGRTRQQAQAGELMKSLLHLLYSL